MEVPGPGIRVSILSAPDGDLPSKRTNQLTHPSCVWVLPCSAFAPIISYVFVYRTAVGWRAIYIFLSAFNALITAAWFW